MKANLFFILSFALFLYASRKTTQSRAEDKSLSFYISQHKSRELSSGSFTIVLTEISIMREILRTFHAQRLASANILQTFGNDNYFATCCEPYNSRQIRSQTGHH